jgi:hypothetical protein
MLTIENRYKPITAETVDQIGSALLAAKDEHERAIAMAEAAADALTPIAHYVKADARACRRIEETCPGVRASIQRSAPLYGKAFYRARVWSWGPDGTVGSRAGFAEVHVNLIEPETSSRVLDAKLDRIGNARPAWVATGNPGCHMQIGAGLIRDGSNIRVAHPVDLLDASYAAARD